MIGAELAAARAAGAPGWLAGLRRSSWETFESLPFPSPRDEDWRRTDIRRFELEGFQPLSDVEPGVVAAMLRQRDRAAPEAAVLIDGPVPLAVRDADTLLAQGVILSTLEEAATRHPELAQRALRRTLVSCWVPWKILRLIRSRYYLRMAQFSPMTR
jgi:hypothetical protein